MSRILIILLVCLYTNVCYAVHNQNATTATIDNPTILLLYRGQNSLETEIMENIRCASNLDFKYTVNVNSVWFRKDPYMYDFFSSHADIQNASNNVRQAIQKYDYICLVSLFARSEIDITGNIKILNLHTLQIERDSPIYSNGMDSMYYAAIDVYQSISYFFQNRGVIKKIEKIDGKYYAYAYFRKKLIPDVVKSVYTHIGKHNINIARTEQKAEMIDIYDSDNLEWGESVMKLKVKKNVRVEDTVMLNYGIRHF